MKDKKNVRLASTVLRNRVEDNCAKLFTLTARSPEDLQQMKKDLEDHCNAVRLFLQGYSDSIVTSTLLSSEPKDKLTVLQLCRTAFTGEAILGSDIKFPNLTELTLVDNKQLTEAGLVQLLRVPGDKLTHLWLDGRGTAFTGEALLGANIKFPNLTELTLVDNKQLTDAGLVQLLRVPGEKLTHLMLNGTAFTGEALLGANIKFPNLTMLALTNNKQLTGAGLVAVLNLPGEKLRFLGLFCLHFSADVTDLSALKFPALEELSLLFCEHLTRARLLVLLRLSRLNLRRLEVQHSNLQVSMDDDEIIGLCPNVTIL